MNTLIGLKQDMTKMFTDDNKSVPVTLVSVKECVKAKTLNGATYVGLGRKKEGKTLVGQFKDLGYTPRYLKTIKGESDVDLNNLEVNDIVTVVGISKGKGFQGVVKRYNFAGGPKTHGQSDKHRHPGSNGSGTTPGRVWKGKRMAGRMGNDKITVKNVIVMAVDKENGIVALKGSLPGGRRTLLTLIKK